MAYILLPLGVTVILWRSGILHYIVKAYDRLGRVPAFYRSACHTWVRTPAVGPLRVFATEHAARAFIASRRSFTPLELCVETI